MFDVFAGDPIPKDTHARRQYVSQVAGVYKDLLEPKLKHMISATLFDVGQLSNSRDDDMALKGAVYALRELMRWGDIMVNEALADQRGEDVSKAD